MEFRPEHAAPETTQQVDVRPLVLPGDGTAAAAASTRADTVSTLFASMVFPLVGGLVPVEGRRARVTGAPGGRRLHLRLSQLTSFTAGERAGTPLVHAVLGGSAHR